MPARHPLMLTLASAVVGLLLAGNAAFAATPADALKEKMQCEFDKTPLKDVADFVTQVQTPVKLDAGVDGTAPVTIKHNGTLKEMLEKMLPPLGLEYVADAKEIVIRKKKAEK